METKPLPSQAELSELLRYDPETGQLFWRERDVGRFNDPPRGQDIGARSWNSTYANREAFTHRNHSGYCVGTLGKKQYKAHRIIYKLVYGEDPLEIDHINMNRSDNRLCNLRSVTRAENCSHFTGPPAGQSWSDLRKRTA